MPGKASAVTGAAIKQAIESRDGRMLASFYADSATLRIVDHSNPPSKPREINGKAAISAYWEDICSRAMTHTVESSVAEGNRLAFSETCVYPDGAKVLCQAMLEFENGKIARQAVIQAWDE
jgi:hypothetical protein